MYYNFCYNTTVEGLPCSQAQGSTTLYDRVVTVKGVGSAGEAGPGGDAASLSYAGSTGLWVGAAPLSLTLLPSYLPAATPPWPPQYPAPSATTARTS